MATQTLQTLTVPTNKGTATVPAHWTGRHLAVTEPCGHDPADGANRGLWNITHKASGLRAASLRTTKRHAMQIARGWDDRFADISPENARNWPHREDWGQLVQKINAPWQAGQDATAAQAASSTDTALLLAAQAGIAVQSEPVAKISWRGKFWAAPTDAELEAWTLDSVCETPDGRTVEPDHPEAWLRILRLV